ncbi:MAG: hypothetical protein ACOY8P_00400 [Thermodesulfobacteriota bacterium]|jgi:hypothetical protein
MDTELRTDEYTISISREIVVCKNMIAKATEQLARLEKRHGRLTAEVVAGNDTIPHGPERTAWIETHAGLLAWRKRLREYEEAYHRLKG